MLLSLIHPSRGRSQKAKSILDSWIAKKSNGHDVQHLLSLDETDPEINQYIETFNDYSKLIIKNNSCVVQATNEAAKHATGDFLIYLCDDFDCPYHWDSLLVNVSQKHNKSPRDDPFIIKVDDCLQGFKVRVLTIPIMSRRLYERLGYFWYPEYKSMFVDQDLYEVCDQMQVIVEAPELKFEHRHYSTGKALLDETYRKSEMNWNQGLNLFNRRKSENFGLLKEKPDRSLHTQIGKTTKRLSVLIPSLSSRSHLLAELRKELNRQIGLKSEIEVIVSTDDGTKTVGQKRNELIQSASGEYVVFIDDDDQISDNYLNEIMEALESNPDCIGFLGYMTINGGSQKVFKLSKELEYGEDTYYYYRPTNHLCTVKREIALKIKFPEKDLGEDYDYAMRLKASGLLKKEIFIDKQIYHYRFNTNLTATQNKSPFTIGGGKKIQYFGQNSEDKKVLEYFGGFKGTFLDIGSFTGIELSNVRNLALKGWKGVMVEPSPTIFPTLQKNYKDLPNIKVLNFALEEFSGLAVFYDNPNGAATLVESEMQRWKGREKFKKVKVPVKTFKHFYDEYPSEYHFISIDSEGLDYQILKQIDLSLVKCRMVIIEWNSKPNLKEKMVDYMIRYDLKLVDQNAENLIFIK